jgi:hypothetical protein
MVVELPPLPVRVAVVGTHGIRVLRLGQLTREFADAVARDATEDGAGARVAVTVPQNATDKEFARVRDHFAGLRLHGVAVTVDRGTR